MPSQHQQQDDARGVARLAKAIRAQTSLLRSTATHAPVGKNRRDELLKMGGLIFAGLGFVVSIFSLWLTRTQFRASERAYINYSATNESLKVVDAETSKVTDFDFMVSWLNSGKTPALEGRSWVGVYFTSQRKPPGFVFPGARAERQFVMGPQERVYVPVRIAFDEVSRIGRGRVVYVWGWTTYRDVFDHGDVHLTEFCEEVQSVDAQGDPNTFVPAGAVDLTNPGLKLRVGTVPCGWHACYDEACPDYAEKIRGK